jgi:rhamnogalacturonyl hydrolase YesR
VYRVQNVQRKPVLWWEKWKNSKTKMFQEPENNLAVIWRSSQKAWIAAATMEEWLNMFDAKVKKENRNAILFLDNATCYPKVTLSNVKIA